MMKNKLQIALTTLFGVLVFCFWLFVRPAVIMEREALQLFLWNGDYLAERLAVPGGFAAPSQDGCPRNGKKVGESEATIHSN